jgi:branched-chain amino acid transport system substrate-binding protein
MDACKDTGITVTTAEVYVEGDTDYSGQIAKIINTNPDAVFCSTFSVTQSAFAKQLRQLGYNGLVFNKETLSADNIAVAGDAANYWAFMFPYITYSTVEESPEGTTLRKFLEDFYAEYNEMPFHDCAYRGYDSMKVLAAAVEKAGTLDGKAVRDALESINDFDGIGGTYDFTQGDREGIHSFNAYIIIDQKPTDLDAWIESGEYERFKAAQ